MTCMRSRDWKRVLTGVYVVGAALLIFTRLGAFDRLISLGVLVAFLATAAALRSYIHMRYRDYVFEPLRPDDLPSDTYAAFNRFTPEFMQLGCGLVGDFRLAYGPRPVFSRYFLSQDDRMRGQAFDFDGIMAASFTTVFSDGLLLETVAGPERGTKLSETEKLWFQKAGPVSIAELYRLHCAAIGNYEQNRGATALKVTTAKLGDFVQYGHRLVWWAKRLLPKHLGQPQVPTKEVASVQPAHV